MHLQGVIGKAETGRIYGSHAEVEQLRGLLAQVQAKEEAAKAAATGAAKVAEASG